MNVYLICPVRNVTQDQQNEIDDYAKSLEDEGCCVHNPKYAVDQADDTGWNICEGHLAAMKSSDRVDVFWDVTSKGSHFDLGMAFALRKDVRLVREYQPDTEGKSYVKVMQRMDLVKRVLGTIGIEGFSLSDEQTNNLRNLLYEITR
jgi:nucleoside 2-deoxyribosyltransferase